jgi:hypothetical protein
VQQQLPIPGSAALESPGNLRHCAMQLACLFPGSARPPSGRPLIPIAGPNPIRSDKTVLRSFWSTENANS